MDLVVPHYDVAGPRRGRPRVNLEQMLRLSCLPPWSDLSDPATEEEVTDSLRRSRTSPRACCGHGGPGPGSTRLHKSPTWDGAALCRAAVPHGGVSRQRHCRTMAASGAHRQNAIRWQDRSPRSPIEAWECADQSQRTVMGSRWAWSCRRTWPSPGPGRPDATNTLKRAVGEIMRGQDRAAQPHRGRETGMPGTTETGSPGRESAAQIHRTMQMQRAGMFPPLGSRLIGISGWVQSALGAAPPARRVKCVQATLGILRAAQSIAQRIRSLRQQFWIPPGVGTCDRIPRAGIFPRRAGVWLAGRKS